MNLKETISTVLNEEENRVFPDMFGYRFYFYFGEGYSERPHIHFYGDWIPISKGSKKDNQGAISLEKKGYEPHGEAIGILDKKTFKYVCKQLSDNNKFKHICERWNNETNSVNKFPKFTKIVNTYSLDKENNFIILN